MLFSLNSSSEIFKFEFKFKLNINLDEHIQSYKK